MTHNWSRFVFGLLIGSGVSGSYVALARLDRADLIMLLVGLKLVSVCVLLLFPRWRMLAAGILLSSLVGTLILFHIVCGGPIP
jgi:hypothetical protein